jgi:hypothetical protein
MRKSSGRTCSNRPEATECLGVCPEYASQAESDLRVFGAMTRTIAAWRRAHRSRLTTMH